MSGPVFVDTNVWIYARETSEPRKYAIARAWLDRLWMDGLGRTSAQVINEYYFNATRRLSRPLSSEQAWNDVLAMLAWRPQALDEPLLRGAREIELRYRLGWWDSLIVSAAREQRCSLLLTEDLQHGQVIDGVRVCNPFVEGVAETLEPAAAGPRPRRTRRSRMGSRPGPRRAPDPVG